MLRTGDTIRITHMMDVWATDDEAINAAAEAARAAVLTSFRVPKKKVASAGTVIEGVVTDIADDGFFDFTPPDGETVSYYDSDPTILINVIRPTAE